MATWVSRMWVGALAAGAVMVSGAAASPAAPAERQLTGAQIPRSVVVVPIVARGKVVNLLYADNGSKQEATTDIGELLILAQHINRSYEALLQKAAG